MLIVFAVFLCDNFAQPIVPDTHSLFFPTASFYVTRECQVRNSFNRIGMIRKSSYKVTIKYCSCLPEWKWDFNASRMNLAFHLHFDLCKYSGSLYYINVNSHIRDLRGIFITRKIRHIEIRTICCARNSDIASIETIIYISLFCCHSQW